LSKNAQLQTAFNYSCLCFITFFHGYTYILTQEITPFPPFVLEKHAEKSAEKKPETLLDADHTFLLPISSSKFLNDSSVDPSTVPVVPIAEKSTDSVSLSPYLDPGSSFFQTISMNNSLKTMDPNFDVSMPVQRSVSMLSFSNPDTFSTLIPESPLCVREEPMDRNDPHTH
jgi:hypothetical protein